MVVDAVRTYMDATSGLNELTRKRAVAAAKSLIRESGAGEDAPGEGLGRTIQALAAELIETGQANREALGELVRAEVGREMERRDMVPRSEYDRLARRVAELERRLASVRGGAPLWTRAAAVPEQAAPEQEPEPEPAPAAPAAVAEAPEAEAEKAEAVDAAPEASAGDTPAQDAPAEANTAGDGAAEESGAEDSATEDTAAKPKTPAKKGTARGKSQQGKSTGKRTGGNRSKGGSGANKSGAAAKKGD
ncbi:coiled-coil domain-containing protein [Nocardiopsis baichengensis]|uniref:hypothetical protein n=1 Tax=Nocardiopsis baichengensis TaxID=280240 RepID=UPI000344C77E|nr:hypothetical protein [Nocardiopsis baichengensis]